MSNLSSTRHDIGSEETQSYKTITASPRRRMSNSPPPMHIPGLGIPVQRTLSGCSDDGARPPCDSIVNVDLGAFGSCIPYPEAGHPELIAVGPVPDPMSGIGDGAATYPSNTSPSFAAFSSPIGGGDVGYQPASGPSLATHPVFQLPDIPPRPSLPHLTPIPGILFVMDDGGSVTPGVIPPGTPNPGYFVPWSDLHAVCTWLFAALFPTSGSNNGSSQAYDTYSNQHSSNRATGTQSYPTSHQAQTSPHSAPSAGESGNAPAMEGSPPQPTPSIGLMHEFEYVDPYCIPPAQGSTSLHDNVWLRQTRDSDTVPVAYLPSEPQEILASSSTAPVMSAIPTRSQDYFCPTFLPQPASTLYQRVSDIATITASSTAYPPNSSALKGQKRKHESISSDAGGTSSHAQSMLPRKKNRSDAAGASLMIPPEHVPVPLGSPEGTYMTFKLDGGELVEQTPAQRKSSLPRPLPSPTARRRNPEE